MMRHNKRLALVLSAAASLAVGAMAQAQFMVGGDGRYREQSNLIGSGGYNTIVPRQPGLTPGNFNNAIITGDVTGGRNFRSNGQIDYTSPRAFRGPVSGTRTDQFIAGTSAAPYGGVAQDNAQAVRPYFGSSKAVAPPPGFVQQGQGVGGFVPAPTITREAGDLRMGQVMSNTTTILPRPGQLIMPGPVDPNTQSSTVITASPLFGVRQFNPSASVADDAFLQHSLGGGLSGVRMDPALAAKMRAELMQGSGQTIDQGPIDQQQQLNGNPNLPARTPDLNSPMRGGFDSPQNAPLNNSSAFNATDTALSGTVNNSLRTGAGVQHRLNINHPRIRSEQFTELEKRLQQYRSVQELNELATGREYNQQMQRARQLAEEQGAGTQIPVAGGAGAIPSATPGAAAGLRLPPTGLPQPGMPGVGPAGPGTVGPLGGTPQGPMNNQNLAVGPIGQPQMDGAISAPGGTPMPSGTPAPSAVPSPTDTPAPAPAVRPMPLNVDSLAQGVQGQAISDLMKEAEDLTRQERYSAALEKYDMAELVVPNSPIILLGRANVELGRTYYARAEQNLRQAFTQEPALLMGKYNLRNMIGTDRLEIIVRDLRAIAEREPNEARPVFLLSYIDYNTGDARRAAAYLDLAEKRAGGRDPLYQTIRKHWLLPTDGAAPADMNK